MFGIKDIVSKLGIDFTGETNEGPKSKPVSLYTIAEKGTLRNLMNNTIFPLGGISLYPLGIFLSLKENNLRLLKHECFHYEEQAKRGMLKWLIAYYTEILSLTIKLRSFRKAYTRSSYEKRAIEWSCR